MIDGGFSRAYMVGDTATEICCGILSLIWKRCLPPAAAVKFCLNTRIIVIVIVSECVMNWLLISKKALLLTYS